MKFLTREQKSCLGILNLEEFKKECVANLEEMNLKNAYPSNQTHFQRFVDEGYEKAKYYKLNTKKEIKTFILAAHVGGKNFINDELIHKKLEDKNISNSKKSTLLQDYLFYCLQNRGGV